MLSSELIETGDEQHGRFLLKIIITIMALSGMFSCTATTRMYSGSQLPRSEICILVCKEGLAVDRIDGKDIRIQPSEERFELLPGEHTITLKLYKRKPVLLEWYVASYDGKEKLSFTCHPGEAYFISFNVDYKNKRWKPFMLLTYP
jgi:hypothetical protein